MYVCGAVEGLEFLVMLAWQKIRCLHYTLSEHKRFSRYLYNTILVC